MTTKMREVCKKCGESRTWCACEKPPLASASGSPVWLVLAGEGGEIQTAHICHTEADRDAATLREVFGEISHENITEGQRILDELTQESVIHFEDGNIEWRKVYLANAQAEARHRMPLADTTG